jgi:tripartite-type tricarboxylate transporter receptor subunit TctC
MAFTFRAHPERNRCRSRLQHRPGTGADPAQWPTKPIKLTVPYTPGGSTDIVSRTVFDAVSKKLSQP